LKLAVSSLSLPKHFLRQQAALNPLELLTGALNYVQPKLFLGLLNYPVLV